MEGPARSQHPYGRARAAPQDDSGGHRTVETATESPSKSVPTTLTRTLPPQIESHRNVAALNLPKSVPNRGGERYEEPGTPRRRRDDMQQRSTACGTARSLSVTNARRKSPTPSTERNEDEVVFYFFPNFACERIFQVVQ